ncbi:MAG TPA: HAMP domain-containing protein [Caldithrix abyssi]|uniref:histidine kinase n=1 Tax=Caldithrix abyssi TaxID=187145 RepID=A0A7V1LKB1_CALAY|nr:HAMP domain-containing protein [Caldithrix abyssi]
MRLSLRWKISGILVVSNLLLGIILVIIINSTVARRIESELIERGRALGANLAQSASEQILSEDSFGLRQMITKALSFESVEYIVIQNSENEVLAETFNGQIPEELNALLSVTDEKVHDLTLEDGNIKCRDIVIPVEEGYLGFVRVGMKQNYIDQAVQEINVLIISIIGGITLLGILVVIFLANRMISPIIYLTEKANEISQGKINEAIMVRTNDEIQDLGEALERLRESVKIALERLKKRHSTKI